MKEIERKYLVQVRDCSLPQPDDVVAIKQGYIVSTKSMEWRVREITVLKRSEEIAQTLGYLPYTTSVKFGNGFVRKEYEVAVPKWVYKLLAKLVPQWISKSRATYGEWILDRFNGALWPLMVAEREAPESGWESEFYPDHIETVSTTPPPKGLTLLRDVTDSGQYAVKRLARMSAAEQKELIIDEVADLGGCTLDAECRIHCGVESKEQRVTAIPCGSSDWQ